MKGLGRLLFGPHRSRQSARGAKTYAARLDSQLAAFEARFGGSTGEQGAVAPLTDSPVFLLSAGWRSGSTLLQRMVMANNPAVIIWGEPYDLALPIQGLADQFRPFSEVWPRDSDFAGPAGVDLSNAWVANLYPPAASFRAAHLAYLEALLAAPAEALGRSLWGLKEVRLGADEVRYLRWLYPRARFVFLVRDPLNAYRSYRQKLSWYARWPNRMVTTPYGFGAHWRRLSRDFLELQSQGIGLLLRYEELGEDATVARLSNYLGWPVPRPQEMQKIKGLDGKDQVRLGTVEAAILKRGAGRTASEFGYG
ncbi:sulfotransferase [Pelagibius sp.]|uniref:sulfotransferase n=1 Tax=Pelagibius sp. TaxID=1931238 RepID=UPI00263224DE|nr:sulfotransferase [Pelagibius sp.]